MKHKLLLAATLFLSIATTASASDPYRRHRYNHFKGLATNTESVVFVGNSITDMGNWPEVFGNNGNVVSRGVSGGFSWEVRDNVYNWIVGHPKKVFIKIGTNDLNVAQGSPEGIAANIDKTLEICQRVSPETKVYIQSIIPCSNGSRDDARIRKSNELLEAVCAKYDNAEYFNLYQYMGAVATGWPLGCADRLHLTGAGYATWAHAIEDKVELSTVYPEKDDAIEIQNNYNRTDVHGGRIANFSLEPTKSGDIIFIGDGLVQSGEWHELLHGDAVVKNHGTGWEVNQGDMTMARDIIDATLATNGTITREMPKAIVLYTGSTGTFDADTYESLVTKIHGYSDAIKVYCLSLQPKAATYSVANNEAIENICSKYDYASYIDVATELSAHLSDANYYTENHPYFMSYVTIAQQIAEQAPELGLTAISTVEAQRNYAVANAAEMVYTVKTGDGIGEYPAANYNTVSSALSTLQNATGNDAISTATTALTTAVNDLKPSLNLPTAALTADKQFQIVALRGGRYVSSNGVGQGVTGKEANNQYYSRWTLSQRSDGNWNFRNVADNSYLVPAAGSTNQLVTSADVPEKGWNFSYSNSLGYYIINNEGIQLHTLGSYNIANWGGGNNRDDEGCKFAITEIEGDPDILPDTPEHGKVFTVYNDHVGTPYYLANTYDKSASKTDLTPDLATDGSEKWIVWGNTANGYELINVANGAKVKSHNNATSFDIDDIKVKVGLSLFEHGTQAHIAGNTKILSLAGGIFTKKAGNNAIYNEFTNNNGNYSTDFVFLGTGENAYKVEGGNVTIAGQAYTDGQFVVTSGTLSARDVTVTEAGKTASISNNVITVVDEVAPIVYTIANYVKNPETTRYLKNDNGTLVLAEASALDAKDSKFQWTLRENGTNYDIVSVADGKVLDYSKGLSENGTPFAKSEGTTSSYSALYNSVMGGGRYLAASADGTRFGTTNGNYYAQSKTQANGWSTDFIFTEVSEEEPAYTVDRVIHLSDIVPGAKIAMKVNVAGQNNGYYAIPNGNADTATWFTVVEGSTSTTLRLMTAEGKYVGESTTAYAEAANALDFVVTAEGEGTENAKYIFKNSAQTHGITLANAPALGAAYWGITAAPRLRLEVYKQTVVEPESEGIAFNIAQSAGSFQNTASPSSYKDQWTSTQTTPVIKVNAVDGAGAAANNMYPANNYANGIVCYSGNNRVAAKPYCTDLVISVPDGYLITACSFDAKSYENGSNLLVTAGGEQITTSNENQNISVSGINANTFRITIDGRTGNLNKAVAFTNFTVTYKEVVAPVDPLAAYITPGKYYYIYNDNDTPLYLFSGSSALGVNASSQKDPAFMWRCIKNGEYYNFQNAATGMYLAHKGQQKNAYNFTIDPDKANADGCLPLYSVAAERYFVLKNTGAFDQGTGTFNKTNSEYSTDFVFVETDPMALFFSPTLADATWVRIANKRSSNYVLTTKEGDAAGTDLHSATVDTGDSHQLFALVGTAADGFYIYNKEMGDLTLTAANTNNATPVKWTEGTPTKWYLRTDHFDAKGGYMLTPSTTAGTSMNMHGAAGNDIKFYDAPDGEGGSLWTLSLVDDNPTIINYVVSGEKKYADANQWLGRLKITKGSFSSSTLVRADVNGTTFKAYLPKSDNAISIANEPLHGWLCDVAENDGVYTVTYTADQRTERQYLGFEPTTQIYRIPALVRAQNDDLVAIYDYRVCHNDVGFGEVDQVMRRSTDNGKTWSEEETIADGNGGGKVFGAAFGDPALVADAESPMMTLITVSGTTIYIYATATDHNLVSVQHSYDNGKTWTDPKNITDQFWGKAGGILADSDDAASSEVFAYSGFFGSGKLMQSRHIKVGQYRRIYGAMLCQGKGVKGAYVVYSDDMGDTWKLLGGDNKFQAAPGSDEPKVEELPNGDVVLSCRKGGGRIFNVWRWSTMPTTADPLGQGEWGSPVHSNNANTCPGGISVGGNSCNGEILLVDAVKADGTPAKLMLQSLPAGSSRTDVEIWYKDVTDQSAYATNETFGSNWTRGLRVSNTDSAYSTMCMQADGRIGFFYEEGPATYCMVYVPLLLSEITDGAYEGPQGWSVMPLTRTIEKAQQGKAPLDRVDKVRDLILEK